jgi:hypothetical protein
MRPKVDFLSLPHDVSSSTSLAVETASAGENRQLVARLQVIRSNAGYICGYSGSPLKIFFAA